MSGLYAVIDNAGTVVNLVVWDGGGGWAPSSGRTAIDVTNANPRPVIGWSTPDGGNTWTAPSVSATPQDVIGQRLDTAIVNTRQWIAANPNGSTLNAAQTLAMMRALLGLLKEARGDYSDTTGT